MKVPLEITYRDVPKTAAIETLVREKVAKLEKVCQQLSSCHIAVEKIHDRPNSGSPYRVRIDMTVPPGHELVADYHPGEAIQYEPLETVIRHAFDAARRQLVELNQRQQRHVKTHPAQEIMALVTRLFRADGYGFLRTLEGEEIYFHRNSVLHDDFDRLEIGTGVRFALEQGEEGPQATSVQIVDKPGARVSTPGEEPIEPPLGWEAS